MEADRHAEDRKPGCLAAARTVAWLIAAAFILCTQALSAFEGTTLRSTDPAPARADAFGKAAVPVSLTAKAGVLRAEHGGAGGDDAWAMNVDAARVAFGDHHGAARLLRPSAPVANAALVAGARTPTGPPGPAV